MIIDQLIVAFKAEGADKLLNTIDTISKKVVSATNKAIMEEARLENIRARTAKVKSQQEQQEKIAKAKIENINISTLQKEYNFERKVNKDKEVARKKEETARKKQIGEMLKNQHNDMLAEQKKQKDLEKRGKELGKILDSQDKAKQAQIEEEKRNEVEKEKSRKKALVQSQKDQEQRDKQRAKKEKEYQKLWMGLLKERDREESKQAKAREKEQIARQKAEAKAIRDSAIATKLKIAGTASLLYGIGRSAFGALKWTDNKTINATRRVASYVGAGMSGARVEGLEGSLARWGGQQGEGLGTVRSINAQLGAMRFGDTSLVETLGKFGIGGIGTQSTPTDVLKAVMRRVQTLGKDSAESFALMSAMNFSDAMMKIMQEGDEKALEREGVMLSVEEKILKTNQESFNAVKELEKATLDIAEKTNFIRDIRNLLIKQFPNAAASLDLATSVGGGLVAGGVMNRVSKWLSPMNATNPSLAKGSPSWLSRVIPYAKNPYVLGGVAIAGGTYAAWNAYNRYGKDMGIDPNDYNTIMAHQNAMYAQGQSGMHATQAVRDIIDLFKDKPSNTQQPNVSNLGIDIQGNLIGTPENAMTYLNFGTK